MRGVSAALFAAGMFATGAASAYGCPYCDSVVGRQVREGIFNEDFFWNATLVGSPICLLAAIVLTIRYAPLPVARGLLAERPSSAEEGDR